MFLGLYHNLMILANLPLRLYVKKRLKKEKESPQRFQERFGKTSLNRPSGPLAWFHAASVGELVSLLPLLEKIHNIYPSLTLLVTTGSITASKIFEKHQPKGCLHQFIPLDVPSWINRFLDHWRPEAAFLTESELWPNLITLVKDRHIPLILLNARLSDKSFHHWMRFPKTAQALMRKFDKILAQSNAVQTKLSRLGAKEILVTGNLKFAASPLPCNEPQLRELQDCIGGRPIWVAASTHPGEESLIMHAHTLIKQQFPALLTILIPRHPSRGNDLEAEIKSFSATVTRRSKGVLPHFDTDVYLVDTLGEMGLFYKLSPIVFMGGSFVPVGGHNPIEPALLKSALIWGPYIHNFTEVCDVLASSSIQVKSPEELAKAVIGLLKKPADAEQLASSALSMVQQHSHVMEAILEQLEPYLIKKGSAN